MNEPTLFDYQPQRPRLEAGPHSHSHDPLTSDLAAEQLRRSGRHKNIKAAVLAALRQHDGSTSGELGRWLGQDRLYAARRLPELEAEGLVKKGEARVCGFKGSKCVTWWVVH